MKQDGKEFSPISEGNPESLLQQAADGELVLFAAARRHTAQLHAFPWVVTPRQSNRSRAAGLVPIVPELANDLLCFPDSQLKMYLATDPTDCPDAHPWEDHYWVLDQPQTMTREQIYSQAAPTVENEDGGDVKAVQLLYGATKYTGDRLWLKHDSWDAELACKLIAFNYPVDMNGKGWDAVVNWPIDKWGTKSSVALRNYFDCTLSLAKSSVNAGKIKEHDTPTNWIRWAEGKGYSVVHLIPADAPAAKVEVVPSTNPSSDDDTQVDTTNLAYWRAILYSNIKKIDEHKKASARGIIKYLRGLKDNRIPNKGGHDELFWIDDNDSEQCVAKKTISNAASKARNLP